MSPAKNAVIAISRIRMLISGYSSSGDGFYQGVFLWSRRKRELELAAFMICVYSEC